MSGGTQPSPIIISSDKDMRVIVITFMAHVVVVGGLVFDLELFCKNSFFLSNHTIESFESTHNCLASYKQPRG